MFAVASFYALPSLRRYWLIVADRMVKENSPPSAKTGSPPDSPDLSPLRDGKMSDEDKAASKNIGKILASLP